MHRIRGILSAGVLLAIAVIGATTAKAQELTEGNAASWGTFAAEGAPATAVDDATRVKVGLRSIRFDTASAFDTGVTYPADASAHWDLTTSNYLVFWAFAINDNVGFQNPQPIVVLRTATGTVSLEPRDTLMTNRSWRLYKVPLAGDAQWVRRTTGTPDLTDVNQLEIHQDTWDSGFTIFYDGMRFATLSPGGTPPPGPPPPPGVNADAIEPRVLLFIYDPIMENKGGQRMHAAYGWRDPVELTTEIVSDLRASSHDLVRYRIVDTQIVDAYPYLLDGFQDDDETYDQAWQTHQFHPSGFDYARFIADNGIAARIQSGDLDEVWVYGYPGTGLWESTMAGDGGYWCNSSPVQGVPSERLFVVMGWNYERGVGEAIHSYGHRAESVMVHSYGPWLPNTANNWNKFTLLDKDAPGLGGLGNVHFPVNATSDYDYANPNVVLSNADDWANYPNFTGATRSFNYHEWSPAGVDPQREYLNWWYAHMPHFSGKGTDYFLGNWWRYIVDVDQFKATDGNLYLSDGIPAVTIVSPTDGGAVRGITRIQANATVDGALGRVDLYVDGAYYGSDTLAPYVFEWDASELSGTHTLVAKAYELQNGTEAVSSPVAVEVTPVCVGGCTPCLVCDPSVGCVVPPSSGCQVAAAEKATIALKDNPIDAKDALIWKWRSSANVSIEDLGDPTAATDLSLCLYGERDGVESVLLDATVPAGGTCAGRPCWKAVGGGFRYVDKDATADGVRGVSLRAGTPGQITLKAKGEALAMPALPLSTPVTVRLKRSGAQTCWEATFEAHVSANVADRFKAKSD